MLESRASGFKQSERRVTPGVKEGRRGAGRAPTPRTLPHCPTNGSLYGSRVPTDANICRSSAVCLRLSSGLVYRPVTVVSSTRQKCRGCVAWAGPDSFLLLRLHIPLHELIEDEKTR